MGEAAHAYLQAMGIDYFVLRDSAQQQDVPVTEFAEPEPRPSITQESAAVIETPVSRQPEAAVGVVAADNWADLATQVADCKACGACESRTHALLGAGNTKSKWLFVTDSPSVEQDQSGDVFQGAGGLLLQDMLKALGLDAANAYCTQVMKCRTPGGRDPSALELTQCSVYLKAQVKLLQPNVIVALGRVAAQTLTGSSAPLARLRGTLHTSDEFEAPVVASYRPEYLLRSPAKKAASWQDLKLALRAAGDSS